MAKMAAKTAASAKNWVMRFGELGAKSAKWSQYYGQKLSLAVPERSRAFMHYARIELAPPTVADLAVARNQLKKGIQTIFSPHAGDITMKRVAQNALIAAEIAVIFCTAEVVGRRSLIGYNPMGDTLREFHPPPGMKVPLPEFVQYLELGTMYDHGLYHFGPAKNY